MKWLPLLLYIALLAFGSALESRACDGAYKPDPVNTPPEIEVLAGHTDA